MFALVRDGRWARGPAVAGSIAAAVGASLLPSGAAGAAPAPVYGYEVVHVYPHDREAFTQGLVFERGFLYEGTGLFGESTLRKVELETGAVLKRRDLPPEDFGEGVAALRDTIYQITWRNHVGYAWVERDSFELVESFPYAWEGWGLTHDGARLIASDGSATLRFLDPRTRQELSRVVVRDDGAPVANLNELEFIESRVYANVLPESRVAVIDPADGRVEAWLDLAGLRDSVSYDPQAYILNGIAYDAAAARLFVTGKWWPLLFEIDVPTLHAEQSPSGDVPATTRRLSLRVSPNPCRGRARVRWGAAGDAPAAKDGRLRVIDAQGRVRRSASFPAAPRVAGDAGDGSAFLDLDLRDLPSGAYLLRLDVSGPAPLAGSARLLRLR